MLSAVAAALDEISRSSILTSLYASGDQVAGVRVFPYWAGAAGGRCVL